eukprot:125329-Chlamydomonas_euryale.AAC.1
MRGTSSSGPVLRGSDSGRGASGGPPRPGQLIPDDTLRAAPPAELSKAREPPADVLLPLPPAPGALRREPSLRGPQPSLLRRSSSFMSAASIASGEHGGVLAAGDDGCSDNGVPDALLAAGRAPWVASKASKAEAAREGVAAEGQSAAASASARWAAAPTQTSDSVPSIVEKASADGGRMQSHAALVAAAADSSAAAASAAAAAATATAAVAAAAAVASNSSAPSAGEPRSSMDPPRSSMDVPRGTLASSGPGSQALVGVAASRARSRSFAGGEADADDDDAATATMSRHVVTMYDPMLPDVMLSMRLGEDVICECKCLASKPASKRAWHIRLAACPTLSPNPSLVFQHLQAHPVTRWPIPPQTTRTALSRALSVDASPHPPLLPALLLVCEELTCAAQVAAPTTALDARCHSPYCPHRAQHPDSARLFNLPPQHTHPRSHACMPTRSRKLAGQGHVWRGVPRHIQGQGGRGQVPSAGQRGRQAAAKRARDAATRSQHPQPRPPPKHRSVVSCGGTSARACV